MSIITYMATPVPIRTGNFGSNKIEVETIEVISEKKAIVNGRVEIDSGVLSFKEKDLDWFKNNIVVFEGESEFGIYIVEVPSEVSVNLNKFENQFVYEIQLKTIMNPKCEVNDSLMKSLVKDKKLLDEVLKDIKVDIGVIEFYCSWEDEDHLPRNMELNKTISYEEYCRAEYIELQEKQYVKIIL